MILRKEPAIKKAFIILVVGITFITLMIILNNYFFISQFENGGIKISEGPGSQFLWRSIVPMLLVIALNVILFIYVLKQIINKLEKMSLAIDRIMDGDFSIISNVDQEGILSRLESQFYQMSRRVQLSMDNINTEKEKVKSLVTDISHQIRTPLASIKIFNSLLIQGGLEKQEEEEFFKRTENEVDKLEWLANSLVKISTMESGIIQLKKEKENIKKTILEAVNGVYLDALEKNIEININNLESIYIDHDTKWTKEAIFNVLDNAIKYTPENGQVHISLEKLETYIKIDIQDTGIGIPQKDRGKIFERFYRGQAEIIKKAEGSGIGLYLTRKIVEEQGGGIMVTSKEGQGSKFTLLFT
ncbi:HAMP domain-containing histidine kinase [Irregularibacter muris]|uniref:histidine kinase n=1 Tax=Irregularibacter muris TaxID=1796619 RepID=A0AAE3HJ35_9FIRM|nr:HAMP domain-containing sensor histidine kinase [Irregularibacter muris]MCR1899618.1 HAMP domain-containing histidine kinase [Irregularibacter muris]